jgi:NAD-dependent dihydropyrimidine dehydrogenase PreA subunit
MRLMSITPQVIIDHEKCTLCQKCVLSCPVEILQYIKKDSNRKKGKIKIIDMNLCLECRACEIICQDGAILVNAGL